MKKTFWIIDLMLIIALSFVANWIVANTIIHYIIGQFINLTAFLFIFLFAIYRITRFEKSKRKDLFVLFEKRLSIKKTVYVILIFIIGKLSYSSLVQIEFIKKMQFNSLNSIVLSPEVFYKWRLLIIVIGLLFVVFGTFAEEMFFRGYLFNKQYYLYGKFAWIINGFSWALMHIFTKTNVIALLPMAFLLTYTYNRTKNFWMVFGIHLIWNSISVISVLLAYYKL
jgi:membrane protease YdiL (CAAX protease family)